MNLDLWTTLQSTFFLYFACDASLKQGPLKTTAGNSDGHDQTAEMWSHI